MKPADSEGTLRAELQSKLAAASQELVAQLDELRQQSDVSNLSVLSECVSQLAQLSALQRGLATTTSSGLIAMKADISVAITSASTAANQARSAATGSTSGAAELAATGAALRREVNEAADDLFKRRIFDPYLRFNTPEEEAAYRQREAEARKYIEQQLHEGTPEGELNAAGATVGQMLDAHAHGAGESPEFASRWNRLVATTNKHRESVRANGRSTEEFDRNLASNVRRYLKDKGLSNAEIEAALAASRDPLDAVKPYIKDDQEAMRLENAARFAEDSGLRESSASVTSAVTLKTSVPEPAAAPSLEDVMATFRAAGVAVSATPQEPTPPAGTRGAISAMLGAVNQR